MIEHIKEVRPMRGQEASLVERLCEPKNPLEPDDWL
jgi:hypothetical protein